MRFANKIDLSTVPAGGAAVGAAGSFEVRRPSSTSMGEWHRSDQSGDRTKVPRRVVEVETLTAMRTSVRRKIEEGGKFVDDLRPELEGVAEALTRAIDRFFELHGPNGQI